MKPLPMVLIGLFIVVVVGAIIVRLMGNGGGTDDEEAAVADDPPVPSGSILVTLASSSTKADWLDQVIEKFNAEGNRAASGDTIVVEASHVRSGSSMNDILDGKLTPVAWSPGDQSWSTLINEKWRQRESRLLISQPCQPTVYAPIGFVMWRPMAEVLGWPDMPIGWGTIVELAADPDGWKTYGLPEWGKFRFGHSHPAYSNTGMLSLTAFVYGILGIDRPLTADQVYQTDVEAAMRSLEQNTAKYGRGSTALFDLMVEQGPSYVHALKDIDSTMAAADTPVSIFTVAYGHDADMDVLRKIAQWGHGQAYKSNRRTIKKLYELLSAYF